MADYGLVHLLSEEEAVRWVDMFATPTLARLR